MAGNAALSYLGPPPHYGFSILTRYCNVTSLDMCKEFAFQAGASLMCVQEDQTMQCYLWEKLQHASGYNKRRASAAWNGHQTC